MDAGGDDIQNTNTTRSKEAPTATAARLKGVLVLLEDRAGAVRRVMINCQWRIVWYRIVRYA